MAKKIPTKYARYIRAMRRRASTVDPHETARRAARQIACEVDADSSRDEIKEMVRQLGYTDAVADIVAMDYGR